VIEYKTNEDFALPQVNQSNDLITARQGGVTLTLQPNSFTLSQFHTHHLRHNMFIPDFHARPMGNLGSIEKALGSRYYNNTALFGV
jgi:hypothetical protein